MNTPGQSVFITGASSGIGSALAREYAKTGARLALLGRNRQRLDTLARECGPRAASTHIADVGDLPALAAACDEVREAIGVPDVVIASAGVSVGTLTEHAEDLAAFERLLRTNLLGMGATFQPFIDAMRARGSGTLVGIASVAGIRGLPGAGAYSASKAATISYLESLRVELHRTGVSVVTLVPGYIDTPMTRVNRYPMPFLMPADKAAARMRRAIDRGASYAVVPWQMGLVAKLLRLLPNRLFDLIFARAGRKPRGLPL